MKRCALFTTDFKCNALSLQMKDQNKPLIQGFTKDEGLFFLMQALPNPFQDPDSYDRLLRLIFADETNVILDHYPPQVSVFLVDESHFPKTLAVITEKLYIFRSLIFSIKYVTSYKNAASQIYPFMYKCSAKVFLKEIIHDLLLDKPRI